MISAEANLAALAGIVVVSIAIGVAFAAGYAGYLIARGRRNELTAERLLSFGLATPAVWIGMSANFAMIGFCLDIASNLSMMIVHSGLVCLLPSIALVHSVIEDSYRK